MGDDALSECWIPEAILVFAGNDRQPINIVPALADSTDSYADLQKGQKHRRIMFPSEVYPPFWDQRNKIEQGVIEAAAKSNALLVRDGVDERSKQNVSLLRCRYGKPYSKHKKHPTLHGDKENDTPKCKPGIRLDPIVNKSLGNRADGRSLPRRTSTTKLPSDQLCSFQVRLALDEGKCWCIPHWTGNRQHCNHPELEAREERRRMNCLPEKVREDAVSLNATRSRSNEKKEFFLNRKWMSVGTWLCLYWVQANSWHFSKSQE